MSSRTNEPHQFDDFLMTVVVDDLCYIEVIVDDPQGITAGQSAPAVFDIIYRGGTGNNVCDEWNIFWYTRSDANPAGTPNSPLSDLPTITPPTEIPKESRPDLNADELSDFEQSGNVDRNTGKFARTDRAGAIQTYWRTFFTSSVPAVGSSAGQIPQSSNSVTFRGRAEIV